MAEYKVKLKMSEEYIIDAKSKEEAEQKARKKFGNNYLIDNVEIAEIGGISTRRVLKIVECCEHKQVYGYLEIENVTESEVQQKIYEIKNDEKFKQECPDWCINDIFKRFPVEWKWKYISDDGYIVEI